MERQSKTNDQGYQFNFANGSISLSPISARRLLPQSIWTDLDLESISEGTESMPNKEGTIVNSGIILNNIQSSNFDKSKFM